MSNLVNGGLTLKCNNSALVQKIHCIVTLFKIVHIP